jgi:hypothetical protein
MRVGKSKIVCMNGFFDKTFIAELRMLMDLLILLQKTHFRQL